MDHVWMIKCSLVSESPLPFPPSRDHRSGRWGLSGSTSPSKLNMKGRDDWKAHCRRLWDGSRNSTAAKADKETLFMLDSLVYISFLCNHSKTSAIPPTCSYFGIHTIIRFHLCILCCNECSFSKRPLLRPILSSKSTLRSKTDCDCISVQMRCSKPYSSS